MLKKIEELFLYVAGFCIVALGVMITLTVLLRNFFNTGVPDVVTIVGELMVGGVFLPLAYVTAKYHHIAIDFLFKLLSRRLRLVILAFGSFIVLFPMFLVAFAAWGSFSHAMSSGAYFFGELELPEWPGRLAFFVGFALFYIRLVIIFFQDLRAAYLNDVNYLAARTDSDDRIEES